MLRVHRCGCVTHPEDDLPSAVYYAWKYNSHNSFYYVNTRVQCYEHYIAKEGEQLYSFERLKYGVAYLKWCKTRKIGPNIMKMAEELMKSWDWPTMGWILVTLTLVVTCGILGTSCQRQSLQFDMKCADHCSELGTMKFNSQMGSGTCECIDETIIKNVKKVGN